MVKKNPDFSKALMQLSGTMIAIIVSARVAFHESFKKIQYSNALSLMQIAAVFILITLILSLCNGFLNYFQKIDNSVHVTIDIISAIIIIIGTVLLLSVIMFSIL